MPGVQTAHTVAEALAAYFPAGQLVHDVEATAPANSPMSQLTHAVAFVVLMYAPALHW